MSLHLRPLDMSHFVPRIPWRCRKPGLQAELNCDNDVVPAHSSASRFFQQVRYLRWIGNILGLRTYLELKLMNDLYPNGSCWYRFIPTNGIFIYLFQVHELANIGEFPFREWYLFFFPPAQRWNLLSSVARWRGVVLFEIRAPCFGWW